MPYKGIIENIPMFCYPKYTMSKYINIFGQGLGILFRSVKSSVLLSLLSLKQNQCSVTRSSENGRF